MGYLGNGLTVWNRAVEINGDYQNIAHISPEGEITFYVQDLPQGVVERIRQAAEREKPKDAALPEFYQAYLKTKADNPSSLVLYQVGDFFEAYADDAEVVGTALDLTQTTRAVDHNTRVPMVGFPQHRLETYLTMLTDRGYDVEVNALEDGKRSTRTVVSTTKEAPVESKPIGRIDYLGTDGKVGESIEYTSPYQFEKDIKEENYYGVPMSIVLYKDKDGSTIPHDFVHSSLTHRPRALRSSTARICRKMLWTRRSISLMIFAVRSISVRTVRTTPTLLMSALPTPRLRTISTKYRQGSTLWISASKLLQMARSSAVCSMRLLKN